MSIVRHGNTVSLRDWMQKVPAVKAGIIAHDQLRQLKNTFIVSTTLVCRNVIRLSTRFMKETGVTLTDYILFTQNIPSNLCSRRNKSSVDSTKPKSK